ncbi:Inactive N-acetylated-alpha-linked acidic dipeptidase-like protein 2 [Triplophysa tibetana]|uniref:Inactive N-acetylated-alpha-linked acidic dipeptidase-like protein 2 n=1 Tax=Triplophysa tibetana TaxID=1572043 RepID=A0A5A9NCU1_9TELE|nr:Inactive N-acetylated-alpha-linked acidic dipeptidase-like protein 2 [Triplophysa tibetana]
MLMIRDGLGPKRALDILAQNGPQLGGGTPFGGKSPDAFVDVPFPLWLFRYLDSLSGLKEVPKVKYIAQRWESLGLKDIQVTNHTALLSGPGPALSRIIIKSSNQCYVPSGARCDQPSTDTAEPFGFAAYSAVGSLEAEVVDVQYGSPEDLRRVQDKSNKIALMKLGQAPLIYKLSLLEELGFGGSLLYVDPRDSSFGNKTFGVTLNPGGNPSSQDAPRTMRKIINLTIENQAAFKMVQNVIGYLKGKTNPDRYVLVGSRHGSWYEGALADWGNSAAVMTQIIVSMMAQARAGWQPDRTIVFCSWGGTSLGNIGSFEWGKENAVVLQSRAVAYVSLHSPVRTTSSLQSIASPSLQQLASDIQKSLPRNETHDALISMLIEQKAIQSKTQLCLRLDLDERLQIIRRDNFNANHLELLQLRNLSSEYALRKAPGILHIINILRHFNSAINHITALQLRYGELNAMFLPAAHYIGEAEKDHPEMFLVILKCSTTGLNGFPFSTAGVCSALSLREKYLMSCNRGAVCPGPNVSSLQTPGDTSFFSNQLAIPTVEYTYSDVPKTVRCTHMHTHTIINLFSKRGYFLTEAFYPLESSLRETLDPAFKLHETIAKITAEAILRLATDPVLPFYPLDIALDVQNKLKDDPLTQMDLENVAASLRESSAFFQSEIMRPANDPKERDPAHVRMLNDVLRDLEKSFLISNPPSGLYRNILYGLSKQSPCFSISKDAQEVPWHNSINRSQALVSYAIRSAEKLVQSGIDLFENDNETPL